MKKSKLISFLAVIILICIQSFYFLDYINHEQVILYSDQYSFYEYSLIYYKTLTGADIITSAMTIFSHGYKGPLFPIISSFGYLLFGVSQNNALIANILIIDITLISLFFLEKKITKNDIALSPFIICLIPLFLSSSRMYFSDFALPPVLLLCFLTCMNAIEKISARNTAWMGIILGLGTLIKPTFFVYIFVIVSFSFIICVRKYGIKPALLSYALASAIGLIICSWWIILNFHSIIGIYLFENTYGSEAYMHSPLDGPLNHFGYYLQNFYVNSPIISVIFLIFFVFTSLFFCKKLIGFSILTCSLIFIIALFSFIFKRDMRYIWPILPLIALTIGAALSMIVKKEFEKIVIVFLLLIIASFSIMNFYSIKDIHYNPEWDRLLETVKNGGVERIIIASNSDVPYFFLVDAYRFKRLSAIPESCVDYEVDISRKDDSLFLSSEGDCSITSPNDESRCNAMKKCIEDIERTRILQNLSTYDLRINGESEKRYLLRRNG